jgi:8-oxo-dGTP pyrophosphatase MutT (NUDIX family)
VQDPRVAALLVHIANHPPLDDEEQSAFDHLRRLLSGPHDAFARSTLPTHVTASAVVLDERSGRVLLHLHRRIRRWLQPGGHIELDEAPGDAAVRETIEETGIAVRHPSGGPRVLHVDEHPGPDGHLHLDLRFLLLADSEAPPAGWGEDTGVGPGPTLRWATLTEAQEIGDRSLARAIQALAQLER